MTISIKSAIKKIESNPQSVVLYLSGLETKTVYCFTIYTTQRFAIQNPELPSSTVYAYYSPEFRASIRSSFGEFYVFTPPRFPIIALVLACGYLGGMGIFLIACLIRENIKVKKEIERKESFLILRGVD
jgi:hypothetical protein